MPLIKLSRLNVKNLKSTPVLHSVVETLHARFLLERFYCSGSTQDFHNYQHISAFIAGLLKSKKKDGWKSFCLHLNSSLFRNSYSPYI